MPEGPGQRRERPGRPPENPPPIGWALTAAGRRARTLSSHAVVLVAAVLLGACRSTAPIAAPPGAIPDAFPNHTVREILEKLPATPPAFDTLYAETLVAVSSPEENGRFSTRIAYRRNDSLLVRIRFPLGIEGARVLVAGDSAWIYDRVHDEVAYGLIADVARVLPGAILGPNLIDDALDFIKPDPNIDWRLTSDTLRYHLISPDATRRIVVDPAIWRVVHVESRDPAGTVLEQRWYTEFSSINEHVLPLRLTMSRPVDDTRLSMVIREIDTTPGRLSFDLGLRRGTRRILIRE